MCEKLAEEYDKKNSKWCRDKTTFTTT
jgi:hypothetical protein